MIGRLEKNELEKFAVSIETGGGPFFVLKFIILRCSGLLFSHAIISYAPSYTRGHRFDGIQAEVYLH